MVHNIVAGIFALISFILFLLGVFCEPSYSTILGKTNLGRSMAWFFSFLAGFTAFMVHFLGFFH